MRLSISCHGREEEVGEEMWSAGFSTAGGQTYPMYKTLLHLMKTSPKAPFDLPFSISSVFANYRVSPVLNGHSVYRAALTRCV